MKNNQLLSIMKALELSEVPFWRAVLKNLRRPKRNYPSVNLRKVEEHAKERVVVVPGSVLGVGKLTKKVTIAALHFSDSASKKIAASGSTALTIPECFKKYADGKQLVILK